MCMYWIFSSSNILIKWPSTQQGHVLPLCLAETNDTDLKTHICTFTDPGKIILVKQLFEKFKQTFVVKQSFFSYDW